MPFFQIFYFNSYFSIFYWISCFWYNTIRICFTRWYCTDSYIFPHTKCFCYSSVLYFFIKCLRKYRFICLYYSLVFRNIIHAGNCWEFFNIWYIIFFQVNYGAESWWSYILTVFNSVRSNIIIIRINYTNDFIICIKIFKIIINFNGW